QNIIKYDPDVAGLTVMTHEVNQASEIASRIKAYRDIPVIIGGCHVTALPERTLAEFPVFDYGVCGEGERTIVELLKCVMQGSMELRVHSVKGIAYRDRGQIIVNTPRPFMTDIELDALPYPAFHHYYADNTRALAVDQFSYTIFTSRGCPYNCAFCMQVLGRKVRRRSKQSILNEMDYAIKRYGAHTFGFDDEVFLFNSQDTRDLLEAFIQRDFPNRIKWSALTRANFVTLELAALAKKAGCYRLGMGVESGDDEILKSIGKGITVAQIKKAVEIVKKIGISLDTYYIFGHPGETIETLKKTADLAVRLNTNTIAVGLMVPYPGTRIYDMALRGENGYRLLSQDWAEYDKYGSKVLEIEGLPHADMLKWQKRTLLNLYLKNFRILDCLKFFWKRRRAIYYVIKKEFSG
ncbi:B12-binding domain-containing radical SAM protein, partial [Candidatus Omnitrophota bacterium]